MAQPLLAGIVLRMRVVPVMLPCNQLFAVTLFSAGRSDHILPVEACIAVRVLDLDSEPVSGRSLDKRLTEGG